MKHEEKYTQNIPYIRADVVKEIQINTAPTCFHCGRQYVKDFKHCTVLHSTWMPDCDCISTTTIRIVTGGELAFEEGKE
jgi:hypothetical protein